jgi:PAS domain S-box-containing protein
MIAASKHQDDSLHRLLAWLRGVLPKGDQLSEEAWRARHRAILVLLVTQAIAIFVYGVVRGYGGQHAFFESSIVGVSALLSSGKLGNRTVRSTIASFGLISSSAIFTHLSGGYIEAHFHFFVMLAVISMYQQWPPFLLSILYVVIHHGVFGTLDPASVYNHPDAIANPWKWAAIHGAFVMAACAAYVVAWKFSETAQARAQDILNSVGEGIVGLKASGEVSFVNPAAAALTGYREDELVGMSLEQWLKDASAEAKTSGDAEGSIRLPLESNGHGAMEGAVCRKDGAIVPVELSHTVMRQGASKEVVIAFTDVTERKKSAAAQEQYTFDLARLNDELARSNAELEQFAYVASHDLQEPLRKVQAFGDRLKATSGAALGSDGADYLERMQSAAKRMQTLISDLLSFSRVSTSKETATLVDLQEVTQEVLSDLEVRIQEIHAEVLVGKLPAIEGNRTQMRQLFQNLIGNALKFQRTNERPLVKVSAQFVPPPGGPAVWQIVIQDNGIGFEQQYADRIFGVFQRLHSRAEYEGTGIGLAVCKKIAELHHGTITATSSPGRGATFTLTLPATIASEEIAA